MFLVVVSKPVEPYSSPANNVGFPRSATKNLVCPRSLDIAGSIILSSVLSLSFFFSLAVRRLDLSRSR